MRPTDVCHPNDLRAPASRAFPASCRDFRRVDTPRSLRLRTVVPGDRMVHAIRTALADCPSHNTNRECSRPRLPRAVGLTAFCMSVGVFFPRCERINRAADIPVATSHSPRRARHLRACVFVWRPVGRSNEVSGWGSRQGQAPHRTVTNGASPDPRCLPSVGTLHRIRWPLQPRSRDPRVAFRPSRENR
jgi:hypothetical protein